jgi:hypothetical protein
MKKSAQLAPVLAETMAKNIIEDAMFKYLEKVKIPGAPKFDAKWLMLLNRDIKKNNKELFPLRNHIEKTYIPNPEPIPVPSPHYPQFNDCDTAYATPDGRFAFNTTFMQRLLDFAYVKGLKPKGKIFKANGGPVPNEYAYIEFLILHEYLHYKHADFHYMKKLKADPLIINYVGDFRSNYLLVKSGYEQMPIGLYSDHINYDRQSTYKEMYDIVREELAKLRPADREDMKDLLKKAGDEHKHEEDDGDDQQPQSGDGDGNGEPKDSGEDSNDKQGQQQGNKKGKGGTPSGDPNGQKQQGGSAGGEGEMSDDEIFDEIDKAFKDTERKMTRADGTKGDGEGEGEGKEQGGKGRDGTGSGSKGGRGISNRLGKDNKFKQTEARPKMKWRELIARMVSSAATVEVETTYEKPHRNASIGIGLAATSGRPAALKPGERDADEEAIKICFIVDSSGSMEHHLSAIYSNIAKAISMAGDIAPEFLLMKFSESTSLYAANSERNIAVKTTVEDYLSGVDFTKNPMTIKQLFATAERGATNFTSAITSKIASLTGKGFNVMLFSDWDVLSGANLDEVKRALSIGGSNFYIVMDSLRSWREAQRQFKAMPDNVSCLE